MIKYIFLLSIFLTTNIYAEVDISAQIAQLKGAKKSEKYILMNKIKMQISKLNSSQRAKAISQLRGVTSNTRNTIKSSQRVRTLPTHLKDLPQIPVLPAPQIPVSVPRPVVPSIPGPSVPQVPVVPSSPEMPVLPSPGNIPKQIPPATIPLSVQHISTGGQ